MNEIEDAGNRPHCAYTNRGRGDCEHHIGLPGLEENVDHDGPRTEDVYGKPNGWCWFCWLSYRLYKTQEALGPHDWRTYERKQTSGSTTG